MILLVSTFSFVAIWNVVLRKIGKVKTFILGFSALLPVLVAIFFMPAHHVRSKDDVGGWPWRSSVQVVAA